MLRTPPLQTFPPETLSLDELAPKNHLVRQVDAAIDFEFIRELVAPLYCHNNGRPAIDPVMLIKMMFDASVRAFCFQSPRGWVGCGLFYGPGLLSDGTVRHDAHYRLSPPKQGTEHLSEETRHL